MIGKDVEIIIIEKRPDDTKKQDLTPFFDLAGTIDLDYEAIEHLRKISVI